VFREDQILRGNPGLKSETRATHSIFAGTVLIKGRRVLTHTIFIPGTHCRVGYANLTF
jgi:hypothetical protein